MRLRDEDGQEKLTLENLPGLLFFVLFVPSMDWMPTHISENRSSLLISSRNVITNTFRNKDFPATWDSLSLVKLTHN